MKKKDKNDIGNRFHQNSKNKSKSIVGKGEVL